MMADRAYFFWILAGYLSGSVLYARVFGKLLRGTDVTLGTPDRNPGTVSAFKNGGFACGVLTLTMDMLKGFLPVFLFCRFGPRPALELTTGFSAAVLLSALAVCAPVIGHILPVFYHFHGGKAIAVSFGVLLGLAPDLRPALTLAFMYVFFSAVVRILPTRTRAYFVYGLSALCVAVGSYGSAVKLSFFLIAACVCLRHLLSAEAAEPVRVMLGLRRSGKSDRHSR